MIRSVMAFCHASTRCKARKSSPGRGTVRVASRVVAARERLGLDAHAVTTPDHLFIRVSVRDTLMPRLTDHEVIAHLLSNQGVALSRQGKLDEAIACYEAALELHPTLVAAHYNRGLDLMNAGWLQEALASFDRAIELHATDAQAHSNRGLTKLKLGDRESARADFQRALELEPSLKEAEENLRRLTSTEP